MKITTFNPLIVTKDADAAIALFETLGFVRRHTIVVGPENGTSEEKRVTSVRMKDPNGFYVDIAQSKLPRDMTLIRMNVDDFDEAYAFLSEKGFKNLMGENRSVETKSNKSAVMVSPSGFIFDLCQHIKK